MLIQEHHVDKLLDDYIKFSIIFDDIEENIINLSI